MKFHIRGKLKKMNIERWMFDVQSVHFYSQAESYTKIHISPPANAYYGVNFP